MRPQTLRKAYDRINTDGVRHCITLYGATAITLWLLQEDKSMTFYYKGELYVLHVDKMDKGGNDDQTAST